MNHQLADISARHVQHVNTEKLIDTTMERDDETTAFQLKKMKTVTRFPYQQFFDVSSLWVGLFTGVLIASLLGTQIKKRG